MEGPAVPSTRIQLTGRPVLKSAIKQAQGMDPDQVPEGRSATGFLLGFETSQNGHNLPIRQEDRQTWRRGLYA